MVKITEDMCFKLEKKFRDYCDKAEQHEIPMLMILDTKLTMTINDIQNKTIDVNTEDQQSNLNAMFRVMLRLFGEDYSAYAESNDKNGGK